MVVGGLSAAAVSRGNRKAGKGLFQRVDIHEGGGCGVGLGVEEFRFGLSLVFVDARLSCAEVFLEEGWSWWLTLEDGLGV